MIGRIIVEKKQYNGLKGTNHNLFISFEEMRFQLAVSKWMLPSQFSAGMLRVVVILKPLDGLFDKSWYMHGYIGVGRPS